MIKLRNCWLGIKNQILDHYDYILIAKSCIQCASFSLILYILHSGSQWYVLVLSNYHIYNLFHWPIITDIIYCIIQLSLIWFIALSNYHWFNWLHCPIITDIIFIAFVCKPWQPEVCWKCRCFFQSGSVKLYFLNRKLFCCLLQIKTVQL